VSPVELTDGRGGAGGRRGVKSYNCERAWPSINNSVLSALKYTQRERDREREKEMEERDITTRVEDRENE
jgi:hypothetical protein